MFNGNLPVEAPSDNALTIWPTFAMPPSARTGTPNLRAYSATRYMAVPCGRPTAITVKISTDENNLIYWFQRYGVLDVGSV